MTVDLFIKTYSNDFVWLKYCLYSISKYATNYNKLIIVAPEQEKDLFENYGFNFPERTEVFFVREHGSGYLFQMYVKMQAHKYSSADYIKYIDSDCILTRPFDAHSLIYDGKPEILMSAYEDENGNNKLDHAYCWKGPTQEALRAVIKYEYMRRHIICYHRQTLVDFEDWFVHDLKSYIVDRPLHESVSEFNILGAFAHIYQPDMYVFVDVDKVQLPEPQVVQYFSHGGIAEKEEEIKKLLGL